MKLCKPVPLTSKAMLLPFLREHFLEADPPHEVLATSFEFRPDEGMDLLALAPDGRLVGVVAQIEPPATIVDELLFRLHWMIENALLMQRLFPGAAIDPGRPPRLVLALPRLEERVRHVLRYFTATELAVYEYRMVEIDGEIALLMEEAARYPHVEEATVSLPTVPPTEEAEAALDEVVARHEPPQALSLVDDENVEIHVDDMNVAELGVSEEELLELLNIQVSARAPDSKA